MAPSNRKHPARFPETRWSLPPPPAPHDADVRRQAIGELLVAYGPGLRSFLVDVRRLPPDLADDLLQQFVADKVLADGLVRHASEGRGRFRNFVLKSLNNFVSTKLRREYAARARATGLDVAELASPEPGTGADRFEQEWVQQVVRDALKAMEAYCERNGRQDLWQVLCMRVADPILRGARPAEYAEIVERLRIPTPRQAINLLATAKRRFLECLREAVGRYVSKAERIDEEIDDLRAIAAR